jgi:hypothetical protein
MSVGTNRIFLYFIGSILLLCVFSGFNVSAQVEWLEDASAAAIPNAPVTGQINGKPALLKFGWVEKSGYIQLGDNAFDHYTIVLRDSDNFIEAIFSVRLTLTVRRDDRLDGKVFRAIQTQSVTERPSIRGPGYSVPEFYSLSMDSRRGKEFMTRTDSISQLDSLYSGRVEVGNRKDEKMPVRLYVCFADKLKSCVAGTIQVELR